MKWLITAFAAVGAVMFAKGFVTTPKLDWSHNRGQLLIAWALGAVGLIAIGALIWMVSRLLLPSVFTLGTLPTGFVKEAENSPKDYFPVGCTTVEDFRTNLFRYRRAVDAVAQTVRECADELDRVSKEKPKNAAKVAQAAQDLRVAQDGAATLQHNLALYLHRRQELLDRAAYWNQANAFQVNALLVIAAAVVAAVGGVGYQLLLAAPDKPDKADAAAAGSKPVVGELIEAQTPAGRALWGELQLQSCQASPGVARIAVVVVSGKGVVTDPYVVTTVSSATCRAQSFTVINEVARVTVPEPLEITYTPPATPSASGTG